MKKLSLATVALAVLVAGPVVAADLGRKAPAYIPPPAPPPPTFTGCYVNGGGGYGLWNIDHSGEFLGTQITTETTSGGRGWLGTVGGGCDYQFGSGGGFWSNWVVGAFADYDFMDLHRNFQSSFGGIAGEEKDQTLGPSAGGLATWSLQMSSPTGMAATPNLALIKSTSPSPLLLSSRSELSARTPITVGSLAAARRSRWRDYSACRCLLVSSGAANTDSRASTVPTCPSIRLWACRQTSPNT